MAAAVRRALLRSLATKMARALPPHHHFLVARRFHNSGPGRSCPNPSSPSPPPSSPTINEDLTQNKKLLIEFNCFKAQFVRHTVNAACIIGFSGLVYYGWIMPKLNELGDRVDALSRDTVIMKREIIQGIKEEFIRVHIEARSMQNLGLHGKEPGHHASDDLDG